MCYFNRTDRVLPTEKQILVAIRHDSYYNGREHARRVRPGRARSRVMITNPSRIPGGPAEPYNPAQDLLTWLSDQFRQFGDIYKASIYGTDVYVVSDPEYADYILRQNWQNYKKGQAIKRVGLLLGNGLMVSEGEFWKSQRRTIQPSFHHDVIGALIGIMTTVNATLLKKWEQAARESNTVNITRDISLIILEVVLISIFGNDYQEVSPHFSILSSESARDLQFAQAFRALGKIVGQIAARRRKEIRVSPDILGMLMEARDRENGQVMADRQLISEVMTLIVAGHETTASTLNWTWYLLSQNPQAEEKLSFELDQLVGMEYPTLRDLPKFVYTRQVIEETMRLYPPGWLLTRKAIGDDRLGDYAVPRGTEIYISPYVIQRHPALWEAPERFDPDRFGPEQVRGRHALSMLPFSAGPRKCIGEFFARLEMEIHVIMIAKQLRLRCVSNTASEVEAGVNLRSRYDFEMAPQIRELEIRRAVSDTAVPENVDQSRP